MSHLLTVTSPLSRTPHRIEPKAPMFSRNHPLIDGALKHLILVALAITTCMAADGTGLTGTYFSREDFTGPSVTRIDPQVNFDWATNGTGIPNVGPLRFSVIWSGSLKAGFSETYTIYTLSDDGIAVWANGQLIINNFGLHAVTENHGTISLQAGIPCDLVVKYYQYKGSAQTVLSWSSAHTPKAVIPKGQLYPQDSGHALSIESPLASRTSPAWIEGHCASSSNAVVVTANGVKTAVTREGTGAWYASSTASSLPLGIPLPSASGASVPVVVTQGTTSVSAVMTWTLTDLGALPYGLEQITVRPGDQLLLAVGGTGTKVEIDTNYDGTTFHPVLTGTPQSRFPVTFSQVGVRTIRSRRDGVDAGHLTITTAGITFNGPIADEVGFLRSKAITVTPGSVVANIAFSGNDPLALISMIQGSTGTTMTLGIQPMAPWASFLQARIGTAAGPILGQQKIDVFSLHTSAEQSVLLVGKYPDGSLLTQATLTMAPLVPNLDIAMHAFVSGITFANSTLDLNVSSNAFIPAVDGSGSFDYQLIQAPDGYYHLCHTLQVKQNGVIISP